MSDLVLRVMRPFRVAGRGNDVLPLLQNQEGHGDVLLLLLGAHEPSLLGQVVVVVPVPELLGQFSLQPLQCEVVGVAVLVRVGADLEITVSHHHEQDLPAPDVIHSRLEDAPLQVHAPLPDVLMPDDVTRGVLKASIDPFSNSHYLSLL